MIQKRLAAEIMKCSLKRVAFDQARLDDIKEAITKHDVRALINEGAIKAKPVKGVSRFRSRIRRKKGHGSRKGKHTARLPRKRAWINKVRSQRTLLFSIKDKLNKGAYRQLYCKIKGGLFRSRKHMLLYAKEQGFMKGE